VEKDEGRAFEHFSVAAEAGVPQGIAQLGTMYLLGLGTTQDFQKSRELLTIAVELGQTDASSRWELSMSVDWEFPRLGKSHHAPRGCCQGGNKASPRSIESAGKSQLTDSF